MDNVTMPPGDAPAYLISDATHLPGRAGFYFRPPLVPDASPYPGTFDADLEPTAQVCVLEGPAPFTCTSQIIATFNGGMGPTALTVDVAGETYNALWQTPNNLATGKDKYRLEVYVGSILLGYADFWFVKNSKELKSASASPDAGDYVIAVKGGNVPIKFRIETGTVGTVVVTPSVAEIFAGGSQIFTATVSDLHGDPIAGAFVEWSSSDTDVATVAPLDGTTNGSGQTTTTAIPGTVSGTATITATVLGVEGTAQLTVTLNRPPVAVDDPFMTDEDTPLLVPPAGVLTNDTDPDGDPITAALVTNAADGVVTLNPDGSFIYVPGENFSGADAFTYMANDGLVDSNVATVSIIVAPVNDVPVAVDDAYMTTEDVPLVVGVALGLLANDTDVDGDALAVQLVSAPAHGTLSLSPDGSFTYTPAADYNGSDNFTYQASDGTATSNVATVTLTIDAGNDAPTANNDNFNTDEDTPLNENVLVNDTDPDGDALTAVLVSGPANGGVVLNPDGSFTYTPNANFSGGDSFTYKANDGAADSNIATVTITVNAANDAPTAVDDGDFTDEDVPLVVGAPGVLANDTDPENDALTAALVANATNGDVVLNADGSFTYTPDPNFFGDDSFTYKANDGSADSNTATVSITVNPVNDAPTGVADAYDALGNVQIPVGAAAGVLANDTDPEGDAFTAVAGPIATANGGTVQMAADGSFTYLGAAGFSGSDTFEYTVTDGSANATGTVTMTVTGRYWFVDDGAAPGGDGRQPTPFQSLAPLNGAGGAGDPDQTNDHILVSSGTYVTGIGLEAGQLLIGQGIPADLTETVNGGSITLLAAGSAPTIGSASGNGISVASGNTLRGFVAGSAPGAAIGGSAVGALTVTNVNIDNPAGRALDLTTSGTLAATFGSISSTGGTGNGINLVGQAGTLTSGTTTITNPSGTGIHVATSAGFSFGTTTVSKSSTAGTGVNLLTNTGTTTFGSLSVTTSNGSGLVTSGAGTVSVGGGTVAAAGGPAIDASSTTFAGTGFTSTSSTGSPATGINLSSVSGTLALGTGSIGTSTAEAFRINGGTATVSYSGSITNTSNRAVSISGKTGGTVTLSGAINETGTGIDLSTNTGATINFSGALTVSTGANVAFGATGGGTVSATNTASTLVTTTATALNVANTTIGTGGLVFRSISAGTVASGPTNGIVLNNTGTTAGLTVSGTGTAGTGGTIQRTSGDGISLTDTRNVSLSHMVVTTGGEDGIDGTSVTNFTLASSSVTNNGNAANEEGISFSNLSGTVALTSVTATGNAYNNLRIDNTTGTISSLSITGGSYSSNQPLIGNHGILIEPRGTSQITSATISGATISGNEVMGLQVATADNAVVSAFTVSGNTIQNNELGIDFSKAQTSSMTFSILNNLAMTGHNSHGINLFTAVGAGTTGSFRGRIAGNSIGNAAVDGSGSVIGNCLRVNINGDSDADILIDGNTIRECPNGRGIEVIGRNGVGGLDVTVTNNDVDHTNLTFTPGSSDFPLTAILVQANCATICNTVRADVRGNVVPAGASFDLLPTYLALVETSTSVLQLVDTGAASATCTDQLTSTNTGSASASAGCALIAGPIGTPP